MATAVSPAILQLIAEGPNAIAARNRLTANQAQQSAASTQLLNAQTLNSQLEAQKIQRQLADARAESAILFGGGQPPSGQPPVSQPPQTGALPAGQPQTGSVVPPGQTQTSGPLDIMSSPQAYAQALIRGGVSAFYALGRMSDLLNYHKELEALTKEQLDTKKVRYAQSGNELVGYLENPTPESYAQTYASIQKADPETGSLLPSPDKVAAPDEKMLAPVLGLTGAHATMVEQASKRAQAREQTANAGKTEAETPGAAADSAIKQIELGYMKGAGPTQLHSDIANAIDAAGGKAKDVADAIASADLAFNSTLDPRAKGTAAAAAVAKVLEGLRAPGVAAATERATAPVREEVSRAQASYQNALEQGDTASAKYYDSLTTAKKALATADTIQRVVDLSRQGNAIAGQQLKAMVPEFTNAAQDIKRMAGSQGNEGLASAADKLSSEASSLLEGKPLSDDVIAAIAPYVQTIANGAIQQHNANVQAIEQAYPQKKFQAEALPYQSATNAQGHRIVSHDGGKTWMDPQTGKPVK